MFQKDAYCLEIGKMVNFTYSKRSPFEMLYDGDRGYIVLKTPRPNFEAKYQKG
jgi:hypothetical protein